MDAHRRDGSQTENAPAAATSLDPYKQLAARPEDPQSGVQYQADLGCTFRHGGWANDRKLVHDALGRAVDDPRRRTRFAVCGSGAWLYESDGPDREYHLRAEHCGDRFCIPCAADRGARLAHNVADALRGQQLRFVTLTVKSSDAGLAEQLGKLAACFRRLRGLRWWRDHVRGALAFEEVTLSRETRRWHPHLHLIVSSTYLDQGELSQLWHRCTGDSYVVDVRAVTTTEGLAGYIVKYASKPLSHRVLRDPERLDEAIRVFRGRRMVAAYGVMRKIDLWAKPSGKAWHCLYSFETLLSLVAAGDPIARRILTSLENSRCPKPRIDQSG